LGEAALPILAELDGIDETTSRQHQKAIELIDCLTDEAVEDLFEYNSISDPNDDPPSPEPTPEPVIPVPEPGPVTAPLVIKLTTSKSKSKKKKRSAAVAQLDGSTASGALPPVDLANLFSSTGKQPHHRSKEGMALATARAAAILLDPSLAPPPPQPKKIKIKLIAPSVPHPPSAIPAASTSTPGRRGPPKKHHHRSKFMIALKAAEAAALLSTEPVSAPTPTSISSTTPELPPPALTPVVTSPVASTSRLTGKVNAMIVPDVDAQASFLLFETG
jgi:hypothetical protein